MRRNFSTSHKLTQILEKKFDVLKKYDHEIAKSAYHLARSEKIQEEINEITGEASKYCDHDWFHRKEEYISYCRTCGVNDDYKIFGVRNRI